MGSEMCIRDRNNSLSKILVVLFNNNLLAISLDKNSFPIPLGPLIINPCGNFSKLIDSIILSSQFNEISIKTLVPF